MQRNKFFIFCTIISMLLFATITSVVGTEHVKNSSGNVTSSPLFQTQTSRFSKQLSNTIKADFIGKKAKLTPYGFTDHIATHRIQKAFSLIKQHPEVVLNIIPVLADNPKITSILKKCNIEKNKFQSQLTIFSKNPNSLENIISQIDVSHFDLDKPSQLGLNDTNPLVIFILIIAIFPLLLTLTIVIATATLITCLNLGGCFEKLYENIVIGFFQELKEPT